MYGAAAYLGLIGNHGRASCRTRKLAVLVLANDCSPASIRCQMPQSRPPRNRNRSQTQKISHPANNYFMYIAPRHARHLSRRWYVQFSETLDNSCNFNFSPPFGLIVTNPAGTTFASGSASSNLNLRINAARMHRISVLAKLCPMQLLGPCRNVVKA